MDKEKGRKVTSTGPEGRYGLWKCPDILGVEVWTNDGELAQTVIGLFADDEVRAKVIEEAKLKPGFNYPYSVLGMQFESDSGPRILGGRAFVLENERLQIAEPIINLVPSV